MELYKFIQINKPNKPKSDTKFRFKIRIVFGTGLSLGLNPLRCDIQLLSPFYHLLKLHNLPFTHQVISYPTPKSSAKRQ